MNIPFKYWFLCLVWAMAWVTAPAAAQDRAAAAANQALDCGAPQETVARVLAAMLDNRLTREEGALLLEPLVEACRTGLPASLLAEKIDEGLAKHVPAGQLRPVLDRRLDDLDHIRTMLAKGRTGPPPAVAMAGLMESLEAGLPRDALAELIAAHGQTPPEMLATAARLWVYLERVGMPETEGRAVVDAGLERQSLELVWLQFPRLAGMALEKGSSAAAIRDAAVVALRAGTGPLDAAVHLGLTARRLDAPTGANR